MPAEEIFCTESCAGQIIINPKMARLNSGRGFARKQTSLEKKIRHSVTRTIFWNRLFEYLKTPVLKQKAVIC